MMVGWVSSLMVGELIEECGSERENKAAGGVEGWTGEKTEDERERKSWCKEEEKKGRSGDEEEASAGDEIFFSPCAAPPKSA